MDGIDGDDVGNGLRHRSFPGIAEGLPFLGKIRMSRFNQNVRCWPTELAALSNSLIYLGCVMTFVRYREDQWLAAKL